MSNSSQKLLYYALDNGLSAIFGFLVIALAAAKFDSQVVGQIAFSVAIVTVFIPIVNFGIPNFIYSRVGGRGEFSQSLSKVFVIPTFALGICIYFLLVIFFNFFYGAVDLIIFAVCGIRLLFAWGEMYRSRYRGLSLPEKYVFLRVFSLLICFIGLFFFYNENGTTIFLCSLWTFEWVLFSVLVLLKDGGFSVKLNWNYLRLVYSRNFSVFIQIICVAFYYRFDQIFLGVVSDFSQVGVYAIAARVAEAFNMAFGLIGLLVGPSLIRNFKLGIVDFRYVKFAVLTFAFVVIVSSFFALSPVNFFTIVLGEEYSYSQIVFSVYVLSSVFTMLGFLGTQVCIVLGLWRAPFISGFTGFLVCLVATPLFWILFGILGVAFATVLSYSAASAVVWFFAFRSITAQSQVEY